MLEGETNESIDCIDGVSPLLVQISNEEGATDLSRQFGGGKLLFFSSSRPLFLS